MGSCCGKQGAGREHVANPHVQARIPANESAVLSNNQFVNNNINQRYSQFFEIIADRRIGKGIKHTPAFKSKIPLEEINKKRNEFWETQVEGSAEVWQALRGACEESDEDTASAILSALDIKLVNKNIQQAYDGRGNRYDVPIFCINDPVEYILPKKKQIKKEDLMGESINVKFRRVGVVHDVELQISKAAVVHELKEAYLKKANEENLQVSKVRLFFGGRELLDANQLAEYGLENEHVIQVFLRK